MREYRRIRIGISVFLAAYFTGGLLTLLLPRMELFPVYSWFLFSTVPQAGPQYGLLLTTTNGRELKPPRLYQEADGLVNFPHSATAFKLTQQFGAALEHGKTQQDCRVLLERNWLPSFTRYELVKLDADPVARWKNGEYEITRRLGAFTNWEAVIP